MSYLAKIATKIRQEVSEEKLPDQNTELLFLIYAVLERAKGIQVTNEDVHNAWVAWMEATGQQHESIKEYSDLDSGTKQEDSPFTRAIRRVAEETSKE